MTDRNISEIRKTVVVENLVSSNSVNNNNHIIIIIYLHLNSVSSMNRATL